MKISILNLLRGGVFSLAVVAAFAFTTPQNHTTTYATPNGGTSWVIVDDLVIDEDYECVPGNEACTYSQPSMAHPIGNTDKKFRIL